MKYSDVGENGAGIYSAKNRINLVHSGSEFYDLLRQLIDHAQHSIHIQVYIFLDDTTGKAIGEALMKAAKRGVQVYLLVDGYGSRKLSKDYWEKLKQAGVHFHYFHRLLEGGRQFMGRRLHHKVIVIDGYRALVFGANIADRYNDLPGSPAWLDLAVLVAGEAARELFVICNQKWVKNGGKETHLHDEVEQAITVSCPGTSAEAIILSFYPRYCQALHVILSLEKKDRCSRNELSYFQDFM